MPSLETPPNPTNTPRASSEPPAPLKVTTRRFGELEEHELIHLLDSIDDEISRARFRESIYVSIIVCLALAWFAFYGPRVLFHQGRIVNPPENVAEHKHLDYLELPKSLVQHPPKSTQRISDQDRVAKSAKPVPQVKQPQPKAGSPAPPAPARPLPPAPQPQPQPAPQPQQAQQQPAPQPQQQSRPQQNAAIPDAPRPPSPTTSKPTFGSPTSSGQSNRDAASAAARAGGGGDYGSAPSSAHNGAGSDAEILSDTLGVDFGPYIKRLLRILRASWYPLIPEECAPPLNKEGSTLIRFTINSNGTVSAMHLDASTHDQAIDRAAWGSITGVGQFPPLPKEFNGPNLELRIHFIISHHAGREE